MKQLFVLVGVTVALVGCSKDISGSGLDTQGNAQYGSPEQPKENSSAAPPRQGEKVASDFRIEMGQRTVEVEGVCKLTEDSAVCWKPNGDKNESLATELTNAIKAKTDNYSSNFQFKFLKKNRILVVKSTTKPDKPGTQSMNYGYGLMNDNGGGYNGVEGWAQANNAFSNSNSTGFDQTQVVRQVLTGSFNKETKTFPLRYQFTNGTQEHQVIPFTKGEFTILGNTYEILSISAKPETGNSNQEMMRGGSGAINGRNQKNTFIKIQVVKITNPNLILTLTPADDTGKPFAGQNDKGEPVTAEEMRKQQGDQKAGNTLNNPRRSNYIGIYIQSFTLDPSIRYGSTEGPLFVNQSLNLEASKVKKLSVAISKRTVFVFDKIRLDAN